MVDQPTLIAAVRSLARVSRLLERAAEGLSFADYRVLSAISGGEERASRLAHRLALGKPAISATVDSLHRRGLLERNAVEGDARATSLALTPEGAELLTAVEHRMSHELAALIDRLHDPDAAVEALAQLGPAVESAMQERTTGVRS